MNPQTPASDKVQEGIHMAQNVYNLAIEYLVKYGFQVLGGFIILAIGFYIANLAAKFFVRFCEQKKLDVTLTNFLAGALKILILIFVGMMALEKFGVTISPFIAAASALIFGASFAIQAPLSNYAAGLMIILSRPFVIGNTISVKGVSGIVHQVTLPTTILVTGDGEKIRIPNKEIVGQILHNSFEVKVVEKTVGISYSDDPEKAIAVIQKVLKSNPKVTQTPIPQIGIDNFGNSSIDIGMRYWVPTKEYYHTLYAVNLAIHKAFKEANITIPFPQTEVRLLNR
jgi:small conductance mechanosensitive channel